MSAIDPELEHHMRQAASDLGLARTAIGLALTRSTNGEGPALRLMSATLEMMEAQLLALRRGAVEAAAVNRPPRSSER